MHIDTTRLCPMSLSARLIQLRRERNWTQQDVADQVGLHVNQIKRYEAGSAQPSLEGLKKLARAFSVSTDWLLFEDAERGPDEDLRLQFEAMNQLTPEEKEVARQVLEGLLIKHVAAKWNRQGTAAASPPATAKKAPLPGPAATPATASAKRKPAKEAAGKNKPDSQRATPAKRALQAGSAR
jgi:transcriptional regulator with XRE-family HTH domain